MDNHVHIVLNATKNDMSAGMHRLCTAYAVNFNRKNDHVGPVFQGRFSSFPINCDSYLMEAIRYVHMNCKDKGVDNPLEYKWCSYGSFLSDSGKSNIQEWIINLFGGQKAFIDFHNLEIELSIVTSPRHRSRINDDEARRIACNVLGDAFSESIALMNEGNKAKAICKLYFSGISTRQIERLTGVGRGIVRKACQSRVGE